LIDTVTHAFKVFKTQNMILKDTHVVERQWFKHVPLTKPIDTTNEQHVDDVIVGVKHVYLGDYFGFQRGVMLIQFSNNYILIGCYQLVINEAIWFEI
jgi:hypothetical protein